MSKQTELEKLISISPQEWIELNQKNIAVIEKAVECICVGDGASLLAMMSEDLKFRMNGATPFSRILNNKAEFAQLFGDVASFLEGFIPLEVTRWIPAGEWVITETKGNAKMKDHQSYRNSYCQLWKVESGIITELVEYNDTQLIMEKFFPEELEKNTSDKPAQVAAEVD